MKRICLLVEDSTPDAHLIKRAINKEALADQIEWVADGEEALEILMNRTPVNWKLILLDIMLPKLTGLEILAHLQRLDRIKELPPIVIFSSSNQEKDIQRAEEVGAAAFYTKPEGYKELKVTLSNIFEKWTS